MGKAHQFETVDVISADKEEVVGQNI